MPSFFASPMWNGVHVAYNHEKKVFYVGVCSKNFKIKPANININIICDPSPNSRVYNVPGDSSCLPASYLKAGVSNRGRESEELEVPARCTCTERLHEASPLHLGF